jgi:hypothetical protein
MGALRAAQPSRPWPGVVAHRARNAYWCAGRRRAEDAEWGRQVRVCGDLRYQSLGTHGTGRADRVGGGMGRRFAARWRGEYISRVCEFQGRQHRTLFGGARSSLLQVVRAAWSFMGWVETSLHGVVHVPTCAAHRAHIQCCILVLHVACGRLYDSCLRGQWDSSCCTRMLRIACCMVYVVCLRVASCTLDAAQCKFRSLRGGACDRIAVVGIGRGACCTLYAACCVLHAARCMPHTQHQPSDNAGVRCMLRIVRCAACMMHFVAFPPTL